MGAGSTQQDLQSPIAHTDMSVLVYLQLVFPKLLRTESFFFLLLFLTSEVENHLGYWVPILASQVTLDMLLNHLVTQFLHL